MTVSTEVDRLREALLAENNDSYAYTTGYLGSIISQLPQVLNLSKKQVRMLEELLRDDTAAANDRAIAKARAEIKSLKELRI